MITSDPPTEISCVLSTIIHEVDRAGVHDAQIVVKQDEMAK